MATANAGASANASANVGANVGAGVGSKGVGASAAPKAASSSSSVSKAASSAPGSTFAKQASAQQGAKAATKAPREETKKIYVLYEKESKIDGVPNYVGITSIRVPKDLDIANAESYIKKAVKIRDYNHHMTKKGFEAANPIHATECRETIFGLEQIKIDGYGGALSYGGTSSNTRNAIRLDHPQREARLDSGNTFLNAQQ